MDDTTTLEPAGPIPDAIHHFFGLSSCSHLVLPRVLLQSMPDAWQARFVQMMNEYDDAFRGIKQAEIYEVVPGRAVEASSLTEAERRITGVTLVEPDEDEDGEYIEPDAATMYYDKDGEEIEGYTRIVVPTADPLPPYNRGRTRLPINPSPIPAPADATTSEANADTRTAAASL